MAHVLDVSRVRAGDFGAEAGWTPRPWDSAFFGVAIAQVTSTPHDVASLAEAVRTADQASIDCLYLLADADDAGTVRAAEANGFALVDVRLTLECAVEAGSGDASAGFGAIRPARLDDLSRLMSLARVSHRNTRFYQDTRFDPARSDELYAVWIERSVGGELADAVWVVDLDGAPRGYLAIAAGDNAATIGLVAVDAAYRGQGHGDALLRAALHWTAARGLPRLSVVTQGRSDAAVRFYRRAGFRPGRTELWYHRWLRA